LLRNAPDDVEAVRKDAQASAAIQKLLQHATTFVAVGYGGREVGVMDLLIQAANVYQAKNLYWISYSHDPKAISDKVLAFLSTSKNGGLCPGQDADRFFLELCKSLNIGSPSAISLPLQGVEATINGISASQVEDPDIREQLSVARNRVARLRVYDEQSLKGDGVTATVSALREKRLAGDLAVAYPLAEEVLRRIPKKAAKPTPRIAPKRTPRKAPERMAKKGLKQ
jgi:hypothetical protein